MAATANDNNEGGEYWQVEIQQILRKAGWLTPSTEDQPIDSIFNPDPATGYVCYCIRNEKGNFSWVTGPSMTQLADWYISSQAQINQLHAELNQERAARLKSDSEKDEVIRGLVANMQHLEEKQLSARLQRVWNWLINLK